MKPTKFHLFIWPFLLLSGLSVGLYYVWLANSDLAIGRYALHMDERISFDGIYTILHPESFKKFWWSLSDGGDLRYGRATWYLPSIFVLIPTWIGGDGTQIISTRYFEVCALLISFALLAHTFLKTMPFRTIGFLILCLIPYTEYYICMPKPEPLQLLFLALFLKDFVSDRSLNFLRARPWFWLGAAAGEKISTLPVVALAILFAGIGSWREDKFFAGILKSIAYLMLGFSLVNPIFIWPFIPSMISLWLAQSHYFSRINLKTKKWGYALLVIFVWLTRFPLIDTFNHWSIYTILSTAHGSDSLSIGPLSWCKYFLNSWLLLPLPLAVIFVVGIVVNITLFFSESSQFNNNRLAFFLLIAALALNVPIFAFVHRLWGFYLYIGSVLLIIVFLISLEQQWARNRHKAILLLNLVLFLIVGFGFWWPKAKREYLAMSLRTENPSFKIELDSYNEINSVLAENRGSSPLEIAYDPTLLLPDSSKEIQIKEFWGPFTEWSHPYDLIVFGAGHTESGHPEKLTDSEAVQFTQERIGYAQRVHDHMVKCSETDFCYQRIRRLKNGGEILKKYTNR